MKETDVPSHEAGHGVVAHALKVPVTLLSTRAREDEAGRTLLESSHVEDDMTAAQILVAGQLAEKRALGQREAFNWFEDSHDASNARHFATRIADDGGCEGDVLEVRRFIELKTRSLLVTRWEAVQELAAKLERHKTVMGEEASKICLADDARRSARYRAANPPEPLKPDRAPKKTPRRPSSGDREVRPFTIGVVKKGAQ
jgi:hypothetical protein